MEILAVTATQGIIGTLMVIVCALLILVILLQKGRGGGLAGAFGGAGGHSAFGAKTGDVFTWVTVGLTFAFIVIAVLGNYAFRPEKLVNAGQATQSPAPQGPGAEQPAVPPTGGGPSTSRPAT
jgi:preprotein translocase subunit SecG